MTESATARVRSFLNGTLGTPVGDEDDLVAAGLDSIRMMRFAGECRRDGIPIGFAELAEVPTIAAWTALIGRRAVAPVESTAGVSDVGPPADLVCPIGPAGNAPSGADSTTTEIGHGADHEPAGSFVAADGSFPLALMQHAYWIGRGGGVELGGVAAHLYVEFDAPRLDPARLRAAVAAVAAAHPMLRARITGTGRQTIAPRPHPDLVDVVDLSAADPADVERHLAETRAAFSRRALDVESGRVAHIRSTTLPGGRSRLHIDVDMLVADAQSYRVLVTDLARAYRGEAVVPPATGFVDYLAERHAGTGSRAARVELDRRWWRERADLLPLPPALPAPPASGAAAPVCTTRLHHHVDHSAAAALARGARAAGCTPAVALAAIFAEAIGAFVPESRFLLNLPLFDRERGFPEIDRVIGDFTSSLLVEVDLTDGETFAERARAMRAALLRSAAHDGIGGVEALRIAGRARGETLIAPVVYTSALDLGELFAPVVREEFGEPVWIVSQGPQVSLDAQVTEFDGGLLLNWDVRSDAVDSAVATAMFERYVRLVDEAATDPGAWLRPLPPVLDAERARERARLLDGGPAATPRTLHDALFERSRTDPDSIMVCGAAPGLAGEWTAGAVAGRALALAGKLRAAGLVPGEVVAVSLPRGPEQVITVLAILAAGGAYLPVSRTWPEDRRRRVMEAARVRLAVADGPVPGVGEVVDPRVPAGAVALREPVAVDPAAIAYVLFTSGSTGEPKGVEVSHAAAANTVDALNAHVGVGPDDRTLMVSALEFDLSVYDIFGPTAVGGAVVVPADENHLDVAAWEHLGARHRVTVLNCAPAVLGSLLDSGVSRPLPDLRAVLLGGDRVGVELFRRIREIHPRIRFAGLGGATEAAIHSTVCEVTEPDAAWDAVPYGRPLAGVRLRVVDDRGRDRAVGAVGELWIGGASVAVGYRDDPERTAARFVEYDGVRYYRTGDRASVTADGIVDFHGRADRQVQVRGHRVEPGDVECALRRIPGVDDAVVGVVDGRLRAAVAGTATDAEVLEAVADLVPPYMVPAVLAVTEGFALTSNGKVDRRAALASVRSGSPVGRAPRGAVETALAVIVADVLGLTGLPAADVDFAALGGDSLAVTTYLVRVRDYLDCPEVTVGDVLACTTVEALAGRLPEVGGGAVRVAAVAEIFLELAGIDATEADPAEANHMAEMGGGR